MTISDSPPSLPDGFRFSQSSLQDYIDCRRRFQLRYIENLAWPALQSEPALENERFMLRGSLFHHLTQQYFLGVPPERLAGAVLSAGLADWWQAFIDFARQSRLDPLAEAQDARLYPEIGLSAALGSYRLIAQYDLLHYLPDGRYIIYDWKTSQKRPGRKWLSGRIQTRLYRYLFVRAGAGLLGMAGSQPAPAQIEPQQVEMCYWFASFPTQPELFGYTAAEFERDERYFSGLLQEIAALRPNQFALTPHPERCAYCVYRSLCERGEQAGLLSKASGLEAEAAAGFTLDFEQIAEIEY
jgi:hypothetical protein